RSVANGPGSRLLMVTLAAATCRASPPTKPVRPALAPCESPKVVIGIFTAVEVMLTMRPKRRSTMPSSTARISMIGVSMLASIAFSQSSRDHWRKSPGGGPPALLTRMSGLGQAASAAARPASVAISAVTGVTSTTVARRIYSAVASRGPGVRATITRFTPSRAKAAAQALPNPLLAAHTTARRPAIPRSMILRLPLFVVESAAGQAHRHGTPQRQARSIQASHQPLGGGERTLHPRQQIDNDGLVTAQLPIGKKFDQDAGEQRVIRRGYGNSRQRTQSRAQVGKSYRPSIRRLATRDQKMAACARQKVVKMQQPRLGD